jgi:hypothetical protein
MRIECTTPEGAKLCVVAHLNLRFAVEHHVKFVLASVGVRRVLLSGLKTIETCEQGLAPRNVRLRHFLGREFGEASQVLDDHYL